MGVPEHEVILAMEELTALKRIGSPSEFAYLATFLASDKAAFITGTNIPIDRRLFKISINALSLFFLQELA